VSTVKVIRSQAEVQFNCRMGSKNVELQRGLHDVSAIVAVYFLVCYVLSLWVFLTVWK